MKTGINLPSSASLQLLLYNHLYMLFDISCSASMGRRWIDGTDLIIKLGDMDFRFKVKDYSEGDQVYTLKSTFDTDGIEIKIWSPYVNQLFKFDLTPLCDNIHWNNWE